MTLLGMLGGLFTIAIPNIPSSFATITLATPQGWALKSWTLALSGAGPSQTLLQVLVLVVMGVAFVALGTVLFRKRFA